MYQNLKFPCQTNQDDAGCFPDVVVATRRAKKAKSCSHENTHNESHADKIPSKPSCKRYGAKLNM